jgi:hypothetical protein
MELTILAASFTILLLMGVPVAFAIGLSSVATILSAGLPSAVVFQKMVGGMQVFSFLAIPFFIFAGELMLYGGIADRIVRFANSLVGHVRGGLGMSNVVGCTLFGGVAGSPLADVSAMGSVMIPLMKKEGYHADYAVNVTTHAALVGALMPTSHHHHLHPRDDGNRFGERARTHRGLPHSRAHPDAVQPGGGVFGGREARVSDAGRLRRLARGRAQLRRRPPRPVRDLHHSGRHPVGRLHSHGVRRHGRVMGLAGDDAGVPLLVARTFPQGLRQSLQDDRRGAVADRHFGRFGYFMALYEVPQKTGELMSSVSQTPWVIFLMVNVLLFVLGTFLDMAATILICTPIFLPICAHYGMDPMQFGVMMLINCALGLNTPPVGTTQFVGCAIGGVSVGTVMRTIWPFYGALIAAMLLVTYVPAFSLWLPHVVLGK